MVTTPTPLVARDVHVALGGAPIVRGVGLTARPGEILALVGPNGCGKSTLLSALSGTRRPDSGSVRIGDAEVASLDQRRLARLRSLVTQHHRVDTPFTVREVVEMGRYPWTRTSQAARSPELIDAAMAACELGELADRPFPQLSGGQQARVCLARALAQDTPVMLLDEPTAALDIAHSELVLTLLRRRAAAHGTVVLVVHDLSLAAAYADQVALMKDGELLAAGSPADVLTAELLGRTYGHPVSVVPHPATGDLIITPLRT